MDFNFSSLLTIATPILTAIIGWLGGRRKQNNDFLKDLQESVDMLADRNKQLLNELIEVRGENAKLLTNQAEMKVEIEQLRRENAELHNEIAQLKDTLSNVKTITRKA